MNVKKVVLVDATMQKKIANVETAKQENVIAISMLHKNFSKKENNFFIIDGLETTQVLDEKNVKRYISKGRKLTGVLKILILLLQLPILYVKLFNHCRKSEKVFFHALADPRLIFFLYIFDYAKNILKAYSYHFLTAPV